MASTFMMTLNRVNNLLAQKGRDYKTFFFISDYVLSHPDYAACRSKPIHILTTKCYRWTDPFLAIGIGISAYYLYEQRVGREPGHSLNELLWAKWKSYRSAE